MVKRMRILIASAVVVSAAFGFSAGQAASSRCNGGTSTPAGVSVRNSGDPAGGAGWLAVCNNGSTVPAPGKGSAEIGGDANAQRGYVDVDGDSDNAGSECTDGFIGAEADSGGVRFYSGPNGSKADTNPSQTGAQPAQPKSADQLVMDTANNCG
ncbi:MAG TPA: hypothetical protein VGB52_10165 [Actinomycetota bacterium]